MHLYRMLVSSKSSNGCVFVIVRTCVYIVTDYLQVIAHFVLCVHCIHTCIHTYVHTYIHSCIHTLCIFGVFVSLDLRVLKV